MCLTVGFSCLYLFISLSVALPDWRINVFINAACAPDVVSVLDTVRKCVLSMFSDRLFHRWQMTDYPHGGTAPMKSETPLSTDCCHVLYVAGYTQLMQTVSTRFSPGC